ncbi:MAG: AraC family transcriptional regulator [Lachnospiraceae bacterium]|nr:AraC family transcriptional regulator [Lachnospiraceae bacterium]
MKYYHSKQIPLEFVICENIEKEFLSHNHPNHYIISLCVKDSVIISLNKKTLLLSEYDIFIVPPFLPHSVTIKKTAVLISLCVPKFIMEQFSRYEMTAIFQKFWHTIAIKEGWMEKSLQLYLYAINKIYDFHFSQTKELSGDISILCHKLMENNSGKINLDSLSQELYISKYHLIRKCKNMIGMTPHSFYIQSRIRKAQQLLSNGLSIVEVSVTLGFYDQSHFDKYFRKIVGISPSEYKNSRCELSI